MMTVFSSFLNGFEKNSIDISMPFLLLFLFFFLNKSFWVKVWFFSKFALVQFSWRTMIVHITFWLLSLILSLTFFKCRQFTNCFIVLIGSIFVEKFHLIEIFINVSIFRIFVNYFYWLFQNSSLISLMAVIVTVSIVSRIFSMFKQWIKIGILVTVLYWLSRWTEKKVSDRKKSSVRNQSKSTNFCLYWNFSCFSCSGLKIRREIKENEVSFIFISFEWFYWWLIDDL